MSAVPFFAADQTGNATGSWIKVPGSPDKATSILVSVTAGTWNGGSVAIQSREVGEGSDEIVTEFTATANVRNWLDLNGDCEVRAVVTGSSMAGVNARYTIGQ